MSFELPWLRSQLSLLERMEHTLVHANQHALPAVFYVNINMANSMSFSSVELDLDTRVRGPR